MRKIIGIIIVLLMGGIVTCFLFLFLNQRVVPEESSEEPFLCESQPCNVILIIPESISARHMGIYGYERDTTPFIDEFFGKEGIVFENAWSNSNWINPSFAALFTSQLPSDIFVEVWKDKLSDTIPTLVGILDNNKIPKLAAHTWSFFPQKNDSFVSQFEPNELIQGEDQFLFLKANEWIKEQGQKDDGQPFFLLLQLFGPHVPYNPPEPYRFFFDAPSEYPGPVTYEELTEIKRFFRRGEDVEAEIQRARLQYGQSLRYLDSQIESFISQIPEETLRKTVLIYTSSQGQAFLEHGSIANGFRLYEEEIHIPFLIKAPGVNPKIIKEPISLIDAGPTILDIFGLKSPDTFKGISLVPLLQGKELQLKERSVKAELTFLFFEDSQEVSSSAFEPQVRTKPFSSLVGQLAVARKGKWKLVKQGHELYNLEQDSREQNNLILQWHSLSQEEQAQILPLFKALGENSPLQPL